MKRILSFMISIILIGVTLLPFSASAAAPSAEAGIYFRIYLADSMTPEPVASFFAPDTYVYGYVNQFGDTSTIKFPYIIFNTNSSTYSSIRFDLGYSYSFTNTSTGSTQSLTRYVTENYTINTTKKITYVRINSLTYSASGLSWYDYLAHNMGETTICNIFLSSKNLTSDPVIPEIPKVFGYTSFNVTGENGNSIDSFVFSHSDITNVIGCDDWIGNEIEFNNESGQLQLNVTCPTHSRNVVIPTDIYISPLFVLMLVDDSDGSEIDLPTNGKIVLTDYGLDVKPYESSGFTFIVSDEFSQIHGIPINVYNGLGTALFASDLVQGTYLNYNIKVDYYQDSYGNVVAELVLTIYGTSDIQSFNISVNLADHDITALKGISFSANKDIPDIKFEYVSDIAIYSGSFYPKSLTDPLNFYLVTPSDVESIKINKSEDLNQSLQDSSKDYIDIQNKYDWDKAGYKEGGSAGINSAGENIVAYLTGDGADAFNEFLSSLYNIPIVIPMILLVFCVAFIAYLFYGKAT